MAAAAILEIDLPLKEEHSQPDFDETWYTDVKSPAEFKNRKSGPQSPYSETAAAADLKIGN